jgi:adenylate cyclase
MAEERVQRRLAAILAADVVGYSRLMGVNETGTLAALKAHRKELVDSRIAEHEGRIVKLTGDGMLVEFPSVVNAVACATEIQRKMRERNADVPEERRIEFRIGVNVGDIIFEGGDIFGDGVNVAARVESVAKPGGVAVSAVVRDQVGNRLDLVFEDLGEHALKNIERPVRVYSVVLETADAQPVLATTNTYAAAAKPSIAVLPFNNLSGDPEQEYFSDGITEDIITDLSKVSGLSVMGRNTVFTYKGKPVKLQQTAAELGVKFLLEGSVRKAGQRVRITAQLIDGNDGLHLWAERYDRDLNDIFALQDEITKAIVEQLKVKLLPEEKKAIAAAPTGNVEAYELVLMARHYDYSGSTADSKVALRFAQRAAAMDPNFAEAWALIAISQWNLHELNGREENGLAAAERALMLNPNLATAHAAKGRALAGLGRHDEATTFHAESLRLNPDSFDAHYLYGRTCTQLGRAELAVRHLEKAAALIETDYHALALTPQNYRQLGRHAEALDAARRAVARIEKAVARRPDDTGALIIGACHLATLGEIERATRWANRALLLEPDDPNGLYNLACTFALMGKADQAVDFLERSLQLHNPQFITWAKNDSDLDNLRDHPHYKALVARAEERLAAQQTEPAVKMEPKI